jgi:hypothetical protein
MMVQYLDTSLVGWSWVFEQIQKIDYGINIVSLIVRIASLRIMITLVATCNLDNHQMDAKITFLNGTLNEKNYISQFEGINCSSKSPKEGQYTFQNTMRIKGCFAIGLATQFLSCNVHLQLIKFTHCECYRTSHMSCKSW